MTPSINLHTNSKNASTKGSKNSITFSPDSKCRFHTTLINNQRITKRLFFPTSHSQPRSERTDEREGCESEATGAGETVVSSTKSTSRYNHCPRNSTILESRPTTNTTPFNFKTTISAGIAIATDRRSSSTSSTTAQHQQHCHTVSSSSSNNGCMQQQQPLFSSADNLMSREISIKNKTKNKTKKSNLASVSDDDNVNEKDIVDLNELSYLPVLAKNSSNSNEDDNSDDESFLSETDSFDKDDEKMHGNNSNNNKDWRSSSGNSSTITESNYRGVSSYLTPSPRPLNAFMMSSLDGSPFLPQAPQHYAQVTPQYPRQSLQPEIQESYNTQIPLHNDYHKTLQRVCGTTRKEEIDDDENDVDDESVDWQGGFYSNNSNENDDDDNNESAPYHFLAARTGSNIHRCMSFDDDDYDEFDRDGCDGDGEGEAPIDFSAAFRIPQSTTTESLSRWR